MAEAGSPRYLPPQAMLVWRVIAGLGLLAALVWSVTMPRSARSLLGFNVWIDITMALSGASFLASGVCSSLYANGKEAAALSSAAIFFHTFAATAACYLAPWHIIMAMVGESRSAVDALPYIAFVVDVLVIQVLMRPHGICGVPALVAYLLFFSYDMQLMFPLAYIAICLLIVTLWLTRCSDQLTTMRALPQHNDEIELY